MRNIKRWVICAILFIICLLIVNYINQSLKEGFNNCSMQPEWLFNNSNNLQPRYRYRTIR
jgi:hypothetical protein